MNTHSLVNQGHCRCWQKIVHGKNTPDKQALIFASDVSTVYGMLMMVLCPMEPSQVPRESVRDARHAAASTDRLLLWLFARSYITTMPLLSRCDTFSVKEIATKETGFSCFASWP